MIEISSLTQMAQLQTVAAAEQPRTVEPVQATAASAKAGGAGQQGRDSGKDARSTTQGRNGHSLDSNHIAIDDVSMQFRVDQDSDRLIVSLLDADGEVIRQMPSELILRLAQRLEEIQAEGKLGLDEVA
ncbi:MAG: flagellar protein FlaG [Oceanococcus sp.]